MSEHLTVLLEEAVAALVTDPDGFYVDGTFGRGGHSRLILQKLSPAGRLLVIDKDPQALTVARELAAGDGRVEVRHGSFTDTRGWCQALGVTGSVRGILLDLGVSSPQLDEAARGFSFSKDGPLDMRMDTSRGMTAEEWVNSAPEQEIADVLFEYGEERHSRRMARALIKERQQNRITGTLQLADIISRANPSWEKHKHPATRAFQAIRIFINRELEDLQQVLADSCELLCEGGRLVVISFHSLEDRLVKHFIQREEKGNDFPPGLPVTQAQINSRLRRVGKAMKPGNAELSRNARARSAVMRVAERLPAGARP